MTEQPQTPLYMRDLTNSQIQIGRQGEMVLVIIEPQQEDEMPVAQEGIPMHWRVGKVIGMQVYLASCAAELEELGSTIGEQGGNDVRPTEGDDGQDEGGTGD